MDYWKPSVATLVKLGSLIVHADEFMSDKGHDFDKVAFKSLMTDPDVSEWLQSMAKSGFLPVKR